MQPTISSVHIDAPLTMISTAYVQDQNNFISTKVFPVVPVEKKSDVYFTYDKGDWFRDEAKKRAPGTESAGSGYGLGNAQYNCDTFAFHKDIDDQTRANSDSPLSPDRDATEFVTQRMLLRQEVQWASDYFTTGVWATDMTGVAAAPAGGQFIQWNDYAASTPITDISNGKRAILVVTGFEANTLVLGYDVFLQLQNHPDIVDRVKYTGGVPDQVQTQKILAALFGLDNVFVAKAVQNTGAEGAADAFSFVQGKHALLCYVPKNPGLLTPSAGYTFHWKGVSGGLGTSTAIKRFRMEHLASDRVEGEVAFDNKLVGADLGYFFNGAVA